MEASWPKLSVTPTLQSFVLVVVVCAFTLFLSTSARADGVNFIDPAIDILTSTLILSGTGAVASFGPCGFDTFTIPNTFPVVTVTAEGCQATITAPPRQTFSGNAFSLVLVSENGKISDALITYNPDDVHIQLLFLSDSVVNGTEVGLPSSLTDLCSQFFTSCTTTNAEQFSTLVNWTNGTSDVVSFQSDTDSVVPEPGSLALLGSGLLAIGGLIKKRLA